jgi:glycosyltransferase involved in cell wall biosynthesis
MINQFLYHSTNTPKVSVIMNCLNCSKYLREAIDSVYAQTYKDWEIIFWDNASTDNSAEIAKSYDDKLRYFRSKETVSLGMARNWAIEKARGEYIAFLDCDDIWLHKKLEKQVHILENKHDIDFIYGNYFRIVMPKNDCLILGLKRKRPEGYVFGQFLRHYPVNMQTVMLRKSVLGKLDALFDEKLNLSEEYDLFMRILYNSKAAYLHEPLVIYRIHQNMSSIRLVYVYPKEISYILKKFINKFSDFNKYSEEIKYLKAKIAYWNARAEMFSGNAKKAREFLSPFKWCDYKIFLLYWATFFTPRFWFILHDLKDKGIIRLNIRILFFTI